MRKEGVFVTYACVSIIWISFPYISFLLLFRSGPLEGLGVCMYRLDGSHACEYMTVLLYVSLVELGGFVCVFCIHRFFVQICAFSSF